MNSVNLLLAPVVLIARPVVAIAELSKKTANAIDEARCELHNRKHFDKQWGYTRRSKR